MAKPHGLRAHRSYQPVHPHHRAVPGCAHGAFRHDVAGGAFHHRAPSGHDHRDLSARIRRPAVRRRCGCRVDQGRRRPERGACRLWRSGAVFFDGRFRGIGYRRRHGCWRTRRGDLGRPSATEAADGSPVTFSGTRDGDLISVTFSMESGRTLVIVLRIQNDTYTIEQWKVTTEWTDDGTGENLWLRLER